MGSRRRYPLIKDSFQDGEKGGSESSTAAPHDSLALQVCNQILSVPDGYQNKVMIKILSSLSLTHNNFVQLRMLKVLSENLLRTVKERNLVKSLQKFDKQMKYWLEKEPTQENGGANKRRNEDSEGDAIVERSLSPSRGRKRTLFSQTLSNTKPLALECTPFRPSNATPQLQPPLLFLQRKRLIPTRLQWVVYPMIPMMRHWYKNNGMKMNHRWLERKLKLLPARNCRVDR